MDPVDLHEAARDLEEATAQLDEVHQGHAREEILCGTVALLRAVADRIEKRMAL